MSDLALYPYLYRHSVNADAVKSFMRPKKAMVAAAVRRAPPPSVECKNHRDWDLPRHKSREIKKITTVEGFEPSRVKPNLKDERWCSVSTQPNRSRT